MHLCDRHPEAGLAPPPGSVERALYDQWLTFYAASLHPAIKPWSYPERYTDEPAGHAAALAAVAELLGVVEARLTGPWVLGERYSACDHALHRYLSWFEPPEPGDRGLEGCPRPTAFLPRVRERSVGIRRMPARCRRA